MSDTKKENTKKKSPDNDQLANNQIAPQEMPAQESITNFQTTAKIETEEGFLKEAADNIGEGVKSATKKTTEIGDLVIDKLKKGLSKAYEAGTKVVDELSQSAQGHTEKRKAETEISELKDKREKLATQLGQSVFKHHLAGGKFTESFFNNKAIIDQIKHIDMLDKKIIETGKRLEKVNE